jgi:hypothetical protein
MRNQSQAMCMLGCAQRQVNAQRHQPCIRQGRCIESLWTYICLYAILYANEKDGTIPQGTAAREAPEAIRENWRTRRRIDSPAIDAYLLSRKKELK